MAKYRQIHMEMWGDPHFESYSTDQKLIFIYLITNNLTRESGIYHITPKRISNDTGIELKTVANILKGGEIKNIHYDEKQKVVFISNFRKFNGGGRPELIKKAIMGDHEKSYKSYLWQMFDTKYPEFKLSETVTLVKPLDNPLPRGTKKSPSSSISISSSISSQVNINTCPELETQISEPEPVLEIPLAKKGEFFKVTQDYVNELQESFPGVDILQELRKYRQWAIDVPKKRKTKVGIRRSISSWIGRVQDRGGYQPQDSQMTASARVGSQESFAADWEEEDREPTPRERLWSFQRRRMLCKSPDDWELFLTQEEAEEMSELMDLFKIVGRNER